ncbi:MAG TPA: hypothetical protein VE546_23690, partial [Streptomyces sp.]|uniref:hypothetical protein n=1 Tax=Streptomyces sp. TaxID=1931 RepID=UPI002D2AFA0B
MPQRMKPIASQPVQVGPGAGYQQPQPPAVGQEQPHRFQQVHHAFADVDPAVVEERRRGADRSRPPAGPGPEQ